MKSRWQVIGEVAKVEGISLRQSHVRPAKRSAFMVGRYIYAKQFNRARRELKSLHTRLGRLIRDIRRRIAGDERLTKALAEPLDRVFKIRWQKQQQRGVKIYSRPAPEAKCIGKGTANNPHEFGVKVTITTPSRRCSAGQVVLHAQVLPDNPYDGHMLGKVIPATEAVTGQWIDRVYVGRDYRGHGVKDTSVCTSGQMCGVFGAIKRELKRRSAVDPVIEHKKTDGHLGRNYLKGRPSDQANAVLSAVDYNFRLVLKWLRCFVAILQKLWNGPLFAKKSSKTTFIERLMNKSGYQEV